MPLPPELRSSYARLAAHAQWAQTDDWSARTATARKAFMDRFDRQVDPAGTLAPADRARRAESAKRAYFLGLALKSARARAARKAGGDETT